MTASVFWHSISQKAYIYCDKSFYTLEETQDGKALQTTLIFKGFDFEKYQIISAYYDSQARIVFLGSSTQGLFLLKKKFFRTLLANAKGTDDVFYAQLPFNNNSVLTGQGYTLELNARSGESFSSKIFDLTGSVHEKYNLVRANDDSTFWIGMSHRLFHMDKSAKKILLELYVPKSFKALYIDDNKRLWLGGWSNSLQYIDTDAKDALPNSALVTGFPEISCMLQESENVLLLGTYNGLFRFYIKEKRVENVTGLRNNAIRSLYQTADGLWITTYGTGCFLYQKGKLFSLPLDRNGYLSTSHCIVEDNRGFFWITTNKGLFLAKKKDLLDCLKNPDRNVYYLYFDKESGFNTNEFNGGCQPCAVKLGNGQVSLPSINGLVWFDPAGLVPDFPDKGIFITSIMMDQKMLPINEIVELSKDFAQLHIQFATPYYSQRDNIQIQYSLTGISNKPQWIDVNSDLSILISHLPHGTYTLNVRQTVGFGENNYAFKSIKFLVPKAWYQTGWFYFFLASVFILLLDKIVKERLVYIIKKNRDRDLLFQAQFQGNIIAAINHDIQTPLQYITYSLRQISAHFSTKNESEDNMQGLSKSAYDSILRTNNITSNLLSYLKTQMYNDRIEIEFEQVDIHELVNNVMEIFVPIVRFNVSDIVNLVPKDQVQKTNPQLLSVIIHNLVDNAVKLTRYGQITIHSKVSQNLNHLVITNSGREISQELVRWLNEPQSKSSNIYEAARPTESGGLGLIIVKDLCKLLHIYIFAEVDKGVGTSIHLVFEATD